MSQTPCDPHVTCTYDEISIYDFDRKMWNVLTRLALYVMVDIQIGNIRVSITKKIYATIPNKMQHFVTP